ncbi:hypothetical protein G6F56_005891 [Rhizopus delemar]|nr:hypothetical protein G6F56_005891 [Rhizopus delemar]
MYLEEERKEKYEVLEKISYLTESMGPEDKLPQDFINLKEMQKLKSAQITAANSLEEATDMEKEVKKKVEKEEELKAKSPGEAEAQCAELTKRVKVFAVVTDDMDSLAFGSPLLLPKFSFTGHTFEYDLEKILEHLCIKHEEFIELCILLGCGYTARFNVSPDEALLLIQKHKFIQKIISIKELQQHMPSNWNYKKGRALLSKPNVIPASNINVAFMGFP